MIIASRALTLSTPQGDVAVPIKIYAPEQEPDCWICRFEIGWPDEPVRQWAGGVDSVQALHMTLQMIGTLIYTSAYHEAGTLRLDDPGTGYGFPVPNNMRDLLVGDDKRYL